MSLAWETTTEDISNVLDQHGVAYTDQHLDHWHDLLDHDKIEEAALHGNDMEKQTEYAYEEIARQLKEMGVL